MVAKANAYQRLKTLAADMVTALDDAAVPLSQIKRNRYGDVVHNEQLSDAEEALDKVHDLSWAFHQQLSDFLHSRRQW